VSRLDTTVESTTTQHSFNPVLGFLSVSTKRLCALPQTRWRFNPVLGFLSVSTDVILNGTGIDDGFNPVLGFLSVSTVTADVVGKLVAGFQSRAGFSECLDTP